ncbi:MAG: hypothetical protein HUJ68_06840 [Clostridia bacterium]|nr:hypothetical protein [Clostridia bacterium]
MLANDKYTGYEKGSLNDNNIFKYENKVSFKGYENIEGLNTSRFWNNNSIKIIAVLFYNTNGTEDKLEKDYSTPEYDKARQAILKHLKVADIDEYIEKLKNEKKRNTLISLRENASDIKISEIEQAGRIIRNILDKDKEIA